MHEIIEYERMEYANVETYMTCQIISSLMMPVGLLRSVNG
jgi:hypothetical protein